MMAKSLLAYRLDDCKHFLIRCDLETAFIWGWVSSVFECPSTEGALPPNWRAIGFHFNEEGERWYREREALRAKVAKAVAPKLLGVPLT